MADPSLPAPPQLDAVAAETPEQTAAERRRSRWGRTVIDVAPVASAPQSLPPPPHVEPTPFYTDAGVLEPGALPPPPAVNPLEARPRKYRWGREADPNNPPPPDPSAVVPSPEPAAAAGAEDADEQPGKKKRRSRWEADEPITTVGVINSRLPKEMILPGAVRVCES